jgi:hypothetical protein
LIHVKIRYKDRTPAFVDICYLKTLIAMVEECSIQDAALHHYLRGDYKL